MTLGELAYANMAQIFGQILRALFAQIFIILSESCITVILVNFCSSLHCHQELRARSVSSLLSSTNAHLLCPLGV